VDINHDRIIVDGKALKAKSMNLYLMLNKPKGVLTTMEDPLERPTIKDFLDDVPFRVFPVGRLDWDSEGLLLLTNDGELANRVMNPKSEITKTYLVKLDKAPKPEHLQKLLRGVSIESGRVTARHVEKVKRGEDKHPWYKIIITEGKNRQIRQMFEKIGCDVLKLQRVAIGRLKLGALSRGELVYLNDAAVERIFLKDDPDALQEKIKGRRKVSFKKNRENDKQLRFR
jgi:23S rRNA pseudouridine2605 synthase